MRTERVRQTMSQTDRQLEQTESYRQTIRADRVRQTYNESRQSQTDIQ